MSKVESAAPHIADAVGEATGGVVTRLSGEEREGIVGGLILLEEMPMLRYLQDAYNAQRHVDEQAKNEKRLGNIMANLEEHEPGFRNLA